MEKNTHSSGSIVKKLLLSKRPICSQRHYERGRRVQRNHFGNPAGQEAADELALLLEDAFRLAYADSLFVNTVAVIIAFLPGLLIRDSRI